MNKRPIRVLVAIALAILAFYSVGAQASVQHVEMVLESASKKLIINADVDVPEMGSLFPVYMGDYAAADDDAWKAFFFGSADAPVKDHWEDWDLTYSLELAHPYSLGDLSTSYNANGADLIVRYRDVEDFMSWYDAVEGGQAYGLQTTPAQARAMAQEWIDDFEGATGWSDLRFSACYAMPKNDHQRIREKNELTTGFYVVEFSHMLGGLLPMASDEYFPNTVIGDFIMLHEGIRVRIDDQGIYRVDGVYRTYTQTDCVPLSVSLDDALQVVQANMDSAPFYRENDTFEITQISLCYRPVQTLDINDKDADARLEARPVWRFASDIARDGINDRFVLFVDVVTGKPLP